MLPLSPPPFPSTIVCADGYDDIRLFGPGRSNLSPIGLQPLQRFNLGSFCRYNTTLFPSSGLSRTIDPSGYPWLFHDVPDQQAMVKVDRYRVRSCRTNETLEPPVGNVDAVGVMMLQKAGARPLQPVDQFFLAVDAHRNCLPHPLMREPPPAQKRHMMGHEGQQWPKCPFTLEALSAKFFDCGIISTVFWRQKQKAQARLMVCIIQTSICFIKKRNYISTSPHSNNQDEENGYFSRQPSASASWLPSRSLLCR